MLTGGGKPGSVGPGPGKGERPGSGDGNSGSEGFLGGNSGCGGCGTGSSGPGQFGSAACTRGINSSLNTEKQASLTVRLRTIGTSWYVRGFLSKILSEF